MNMTIHMYIIYNMHDMSFDSWRVCVCVCVCVCVRVCVCLSLIHILCGRVVVYFHVCTLTWHREHSSSSCTNGKSSQDTLKRVTQKSTYVYNVNGNRVLQLANIDQLNSLAISTILLYIACISRACRTSDSVHLHAHYTYAVCMYQMQQVP